MAMLSIDSYEPYAQRTYPLPRNRDRDIPPPLYAVPPCLVENEGSAPFSCPRLGCDGLTFYTARECHEHEDRYHDSYPYLCGECDGTVFATLSALERHCKEAGHGLWVCEQEGCEMLGVRFGSEETFIEHALQSLEHKAVRLRRTSARRGNNSVYVTDSQADDDDDKFSDCSWTGEMCLEECCHKFQKLFASRGEWAKHASSYGHVQAAELHASLLQLEISDDDLAAKMQAAREFCCDALNCRSYGNKFASSQGYYHHVRTSGHLQKPGRPALAPIKTVLICEEAECPKFGTEFRAASNHAKHIAGVTHVRAVRFSEALRRLAAVGVKEEAGLGISRCASPVVSGFMPTPSTPGRDVAPSIVPYATPTKTTIRGNVMSLMPGNPIYAETETPPLSPREVFLESRNRELEEQIEKLKKMISGMEAQDILRQEGGL